MATKVNLEDKFSCFSDHWAPRIIARYNDNEVRLAKACNEFIWHSHEESDELFLVVEGTLVMDFRDRSETLEPGDIIVVPKGVEHRPRVPNGEVKMVIIDPANAANTGNKETATVAVEI